VSVVLQQFEAAINNQGQHAIQKIVEHSWEMCTALQCAFSTMHFASSKVKTATNLHNPKKGEGHFLGLVFMQACTFKEALTDMF
jgi:hypothetical protein